MFLNAMQCKFSFTFMLLCRTGILFVFKTKMSVSGPVSTDFTSVSSESWPGEAQTSPSAKSTTKSEVSPSSPQQNATDTNQQCSSEARHPGFVSGVTVGTITGAAAVGM